MVRLSLSLLHQKQKDEREFVFLFFIQAAGLVYHHVTDVHIIKGGLPPLYLISPWGCIFSAA